MTAKSITHKFVSGVADGGDATLVRPSNWNDDHNLWDGYRLFSTAGPDTIVNADHLSLIVYSNAGAVVANLAAPSGGNMPLGWRVRVRSAGAGGTTVTGTSSATFNGSSTIALANGDAVDIHSTGGNDYVAVLHKAPSGVSGAFSMNIQVFTASGTYTPSTGLVSAIIECIGGGGGGGGTISNSSYQYSGAGGGSGSYSRKLASAALIGSSQTVTIGAKGSGGAAGNNPGTAGGDTSVGALCVGKGGLGGGGYGGTTNAQGGAGGPPGTGDIVAAGNPGMGGQWFSSAALAGAFGGASAFGGGAVGAAVVASTMSAGVAARNYGAGGGGGTVHGLSSTNAPGGDGSAGIVVITEYIWH